MNESSYPRAHEDQAFFSYPVQQCCSDSEVNIEYHFKP